MTSEEKPKPIPIRLPQELEDSLRFVASKNRTTLNSVIIDCLREHLPDIHPIEHALISGISPFVKTKEELRYEVLDRLNRYESQVQLQLGVVLQIAAVLNSQASLARNMRDALVKQYDVRVPEHSSGDMPVLPSPPGTISPKLLAYTDGSATVKNNEVLNACRKQASRHQYDAGDEWKAVKELLGRLANTESSDSV